MYASYVTKRHPWDSSREEEAIRRALRKDLRTQAGQRVLAEQIGIGRGALRKFLDMSLPGHDTMEKLRDWLQDRPEPEVPPGAVALTILAKEFPAPRRVWARRQLAQRLLELLGKTGVKAPAWVREEIA
jgi:hypothetical protein